MPLSAGQKIGPYEIVAALGAGGMGEVYRAKDSKLKREVALKVLPADVAGDRERLARFQREAEVLAALNHPNIAHVYGLEENALVMELVEGEDLAERLARGPMHADDALPVAKQIAEALEAAHEAGIIHRDLKPANVKVRPDGTVKVLDFGLAKALQDPKTSGPQDLSASPTFTSPAMTARGMILGTAAYMAPEQAKGRPVDKRADIWAFGCVFYEMLAGKKAFKGEDVTDTITAVMRDAPDWNALPAYTPTTIRTLLRRCLDKDARKRPPHIGIARMEIEDAMTSTGEMLAITPPPKAKPARRPWWRWLPPFVLTIVALAAGWSYGRSTVPDPPARESIRFQLEAPAAAPFSQRATSFLALAPDGTRVAYIAQDRGRLARLWLHSFATGEGRELKGTEGVITVFWSPDGRHLGFRTGERLQRLDLETGAVHTICECRGTGSATWSQDGVILIARETIDRVAASGGAVEPVTTLDEAKGELRHTHPYFLPDGRRFLYTAFNRDSEKTTLRIGELGSALTRPLATVMSGAQYLDAGFLFYAQDNRLLARPFDAVKADWAGEPMVISDSIRQQGQGGAAFSVSRNGVVAFDPTPLWGQQLELAWVGRDGKTLSVFAGLDNGGHTLALSPDDTVAAVEQTGTGQNAVWLIDGERGTRTRLTFEKEAQGHPVWSPEGRRVAYFTGQPGATTRLLVKAASGTRDADVLVAGTGQTASPRQPTDWSRDGRFVLFEEANAATGWDLKYVDTSGARQAAVAVQTPFLERLGQLSPDGKLIAYESNETGQLEVYVATFPDASSRWPISNRGGGKPRWNANGRELLFVDGDGILQSVTITTSGGFRAGKPAPLFELGAFETDGYHYAISRDGTRILVMRTAANAPQPKLTVITNWRPASE